MADPRNELADAAEGDSFDIARRPVFHPLAPPVFQFAYRGQQWQPLPPAAYKLYAEEGLVLLTKDWMDGHAVGSRLCFRFKGVRYSQESSLPARGYNDLCDALEATGDLFVQANMGSSTGAAVNGFVLMNVGPSQADCSAGPGDISYVRLSNYDTGQSWHYWINNAVPIIEGSEVRPPYTVKDRRRSRTLVTAPLVSRPRPTTAVGGLRIVSDGSQHLLIVVDHEQHATNLT